jgi:hypothetical protein
VAIEVTKIDREKSLLTGKDKRGVEHTFLYRPQTLLRRLSPSETVQSLQDFLTDPDQFPIAKDEEVLVRWRTDLNSGGKVAVRFTVF